MRRAARMVKRAMSAVATDTNFEDMKRSMKPETSSAPFPFMMSGITPEVSGIEAARKVTRTANTLDSKTFFVTKPRSDFETGPSDGFLVIM